ncbi:calcium-binding protein [Shimia marina]|uniref:Cyclolysin n=1 Tax=Shimia marina TaxID=321267 RepID=A0A0P1ETG2_9RHOB|nr:calcium-binding protein [Shimia marina]CUH53711.1 Cyclolysin [Shimia marina]SFD70362.1 Ca2+-binding protein, RTX toxin-related [Shimia marina]
MPITITVDHSSAPVEVRADMFGANLLGRTNETDGVPNDLYIDAVDEVGATRLRYPGGRAASENIIELDRSESGSDQLREDLRAYLDWAMDTDSRTTLVLPALTDEHANVRDVQDWAELMLTYMGDKADLIVGYEIGNEFWAEIDEIEYGENAYDIAKALGTVTVNGHQPQIWVQTSNVVGGASNYKGGSYGSISDADAIAAMEHWDPDFRPDDWQDGQSAQKYYVGLSNFHQRVIKGNLELLEQLDADHDITNGFQKDTTTNGIDGIIAHYYYDDNVEGYDLTDVATRSEIKALDLRFATWEAMMPQNLDIQVTEWNVETNTWAWMGLRGAGVVVEQFQNMMELGVDGADFWTLRHNTTTAVAGASGDAGAIELTPSGMALKLMAESLGASSTPMYTVDLGGFDPTELEVNGYTNGYRSVIYVTSHSDNFAEEFSLDLSLLAPHALSWSGRTIGIDANSSDGQSDNAAYDEDGNLVSRLSRRKVDDAERAELIDVLGDAYDESFFKLSGSQWLTYLPKPEDIYLRPGVGRPSSMDDFYFATETDVAASLTEVSQLELGDRVSDLTVTLNPYEVIEITIEHAQVVMGNSSADVFNGGSGDDVIYGSGGDDYIRGSGGRDNLNGGTGEDTLIGGDMNDRLEGKAGNDRIFGGAGDDKMVGGDGDDYLRDDGGSDDFVGGNGRDTAAYWGHQTAVFVDLETGANNSSDTYNSIENIYGSNLANDTIFGDAGDNLLHGAGGDDRLYGRSGNDTLKGGDGNDFLRDVSGRDVFVGGNGQDTVSYWGDQSGVSANLTTGANSSGDSFNSIEHLQGSNTGGDWLAGNHLTNHVDGAGGNDSLYGYDGDDILEGGAGADRLFGGLGDDRLEGGSGNDFLRDDGGVDVFLGGDGQDTISYWGSSDGVRINLGNGNTLDGDSFDGIEHVFGSNLASDTLTGDEGANKIDGEGASDLLRGKGGDDTLLGGSGNDRLYGEDDDDRLYGQSGNDIMDGGAGDDYFRDEVGRDTFIGGAGEDTVSYWGLQSGITVDLSTGQNSGEDSFMGIEHLIGSNSGSDVLTGDDGDNFLRGAGGNDTLIGGAGNDTLRADEGNDRLEGGDGSDVFVFHNDFGQNLITDFEVSGGYDVMDLSFVAEITDYTDLMSNHIRQSGEDVVIFVGSDQITLEDVAINDLDSGHFLF